MTASPPDGRPRRAVVLSGGGARGAYEAGVLRFVLDELPARLGHAPRFDLICGTSVGAIHACYLAATAHQEAKRGEELTRAWQALRLDEMLPVAPGDLFRLPGRLLGLRRIARDLRSGRLPERLYGLVDPRPLERVVLRTIPWRSIRRNVEQGQITALAVAATQISTGRAVVFVENRTRRIPGWTRDPFTVARPARIGPSHALASAAIPILFPAVRVGSTYYADGGLRLNTPLAPALRLGAERVLVIVPRRAHSERIDAELGEARVESYGNPLFLFGKVLDALLLDHIETDLAQMRLLNEILRDGVEAFGDEFLARINAVAKRTRGQGFRLVDDVVVRPGSDLGVLAGQVLQAQGTRQRISPLLRLFLRALPTAEGPVEADLLSYLLFDTEYVSTLVELGWADAKAREEELARFFSDDLAAA